VLAHTWPWPPPGAGGLAASSVARPEGTGLAAGRVFLSAFAFLGVGFALGEAVGDSAGEGDAAFSAGEELPHKNRPSIHIENFVPPFP
jgi:hypothetical protein